MNNDPTLRIQNLSILIRQIKSYYQVRFLSPKQAAEPYIILFSFYIKGCSTVSEMMLTALLCNYHMKVNLLILDQNLVK